MAPPHVPPRPTWRRGARTHRSERSLGRLDASCGVSKPVRTRPQHDGSRAVNQVPKPQFKKQLEELFLVYLTACLSSPTLITSELSSLLQIKSLLKLSAAQAGTQVSSSN